MRPKRQESKFLGTSPTGYAGDAQPLVRPEVLTEFTKYQTFYGVNGVFLDETVYECSKKTTLAGYVAAIHLVASTTVATSPLFATESRRLPS